MLALCTPRGAGFRAGRVKTDAFMAIVVITVLFNKLQKLRIRENVNRKLLWTPFYVKYRILCTFKLILFKKNRTRTFWLRPFRIITKLFDMNMMIYMKNVQW